MKRVLSVLIALALLLCAPPAAQADVMPAEGVVQSFYAFSGLQARYAVVLCSRLTVRATPSSGGRTLTRLSSGDTFLTWQSQNGWINAYRSDGSLNGWVLASYVVIDPSYFMTLDSVPVYACADADSPRVGLLTYDELLPIIRTYQDGYLVSLRGAAAYLRKSDDSQIFTRLVYARMDYRPLGSASSGSLPVYESCELLDGPSLNTLQAYLYPQKYLQATPKSMFGSAYLTLRYSNGMVTTLNMAVDGSTNYQQNGSSFSYGDHAGSEQLFALFNGMTIH